MEEILRGNKIIIMEDVTYFYYPVMLYYIVLGYEIKIFDFDLDLKKFRWVRGLINSGKVKRIYIKPAVEEHGDAIDAVHKLVDALSLDKIINSIEKNYKIKNVKYIFNKTLLNNLFRYVYIDRRLYEIEENKSNQRVIFLPTEYIIFNNWVKKANIKTKFKYEENLTRSLLLLLFTMRDFSIGVFKYFLGLIAYLLYIAFTAAINIISSNDSDTIKVKNIFVIQHAFQSIHKGLRSYDIFISDGKNKDDVLFISTLTDDSYKIKRKDIHVLDKGKSKYIFRKKNVFKELVNTMPIVFNLVPLLLKPLGALLGPVNIIMTYIKWEPILSDINFDNYIYTNNETPSQMVINEIVRKHGSESWSYNVFMGGGYLRSKNLEFRKARHIFWAFLNYDHFIANNKSTVDYYKLHKQDVKEYHVCGSMAGQLIEESSNNKNHYIKRLFGEAVSNSNYSLVAVFDTTFVDEIGTHASYQDCIDFYKDIYKLVEETSDLLCVIKPSKDEGFYTDPAQQWSSPSKTNDLLDIWHVVSSHPRVYFAADTSDTTEIISNSDLVITHCFSSTSGEALSIRKKAIWYESGQGHKDMFLDLVDGLVAHGYEDLKYTVEKLINMSTEEYDNYLDKNVKGVIDEYLDDQGLSRFKKLLGLNVDVKKNEHE